MTAENPSLTQKFDASSNSIIHHNAMGPNFFQEFVDESKLQNWPLGIYYIPIIYSSQQQRVIHVKILVSN